MTLTESQKQALRQKIVEANPEIRTGGPIKLTWNDGQVEERVPFRPIRVADAILAVQAYFKNAGATDLPDGPDKQHSLYLYDVAILQLLGFWNLLRDSLDDQSEETLAFLHSLLLP